MLPTVGATTVRRPVVTSYYRAGATPGYLVTVAVPAGVHTLCLAARNIGAGAATVIGCRNTATGAPPTAAELAKHNPLGGQTSTSFARTTGGGTVRLSGWAADPDYPGGLVTVVVSVDGRRAATASTGSLLSAPPAGAGPRSGWSAGVDLAPGAHLVCTSITNLGLGADRYLGCTALDTRVNPAPLPVPTPPVNAQVLTEARKHLGQRYVWGAIGPKTFDCSGLAVYTYAKSHVALPRTSEQQFAAARMIPASRAVPGDLVFTHDASGDVYHVGIYVAPGKAFAAIDEAEGVNYQTIWDPADTTYGSFTHT